MINHKNIGQPTPSLRFPEFNYDWQKMQLVNLSKNGFSNGVFNDPAKVGAGYKLINVKDMYTDGDIRESSLTLVAISEKEFLNNRVEYGDLFFTRSSLVKEGIAYSNIYLGNSRDITYDGHLIRMQPDTTKVSSVFLNYLLKTSPIRKQLIARGTTTTMTTIGQKEIASVEIAIPTIKEQERIAEFLLAMDERAEALINRISLLVKYKKGIMESIFTRRIRFSSESGSYGDWHDKKLSDLASITTGKKDVNAGNPAGKFPFYTCAKTHTYSDYYSFDGEAILIAGNAEVGLCQYYNGKFEAYQRTYVLQNFSVSGSYLFRYLSHYFRQYALGLKQTGAMSFIKVGMLNDFVVPVPDIEEQNRIAAFLAALDEKIELERTRLEQTRKFKKALLKEMFV